MSRIEEIKAYKIRKIEEEKQTEIKEQNEIDELVAKNKDIHGIFYPSDYEIKVGE